MDVTEVKRLLGCAAVDAYVRSGMRLGLGTGSTAIWAVRRVGELLKQGSLTGIVGVPTSSQTLMECQALGIPIRSMNDPDIAGGLDLAIDGADEVDGERRCTKGGGGALLIEKIVAYAARRFVVIVDRPKLVRDLGLSFAIPTEVLREAREPAIRAFAALGGRGEVRMAVRKMGAVITDNGNILIDVKFAGPMDPVQMEKELSLIPGVLGNGLFTRVRPTVLVGDAGGKIETLN
jgi:ribose 5-phosphate isomerase A